MLATRHVLIGLPAYNEEIALPRLLGARRSPAQKFAGADYRRPLQ